MKQICLTWVLLSAVSLPELSQTAILRGQVTDESGAIVPGAKISLAGPGGLFRTTTSAANYGSGSLTGPPPGGWQHQRREWDRCVSSSKNSECELAPSWLKLPSSFIAINYEPRGIR